MIEIRTLGRTSVAVDGEELSGEAAWPKSLALIVYMAREPGPDRRDKILGMLWPDRDEKRARHALNQLLYTLRKTSPELDLESVEDAVDFGTDVWLDVEEFEKRLERGDLEGAVALYGGPFLVDLVAEVPEFDHWMDRQRAQLARKFRKAALVLAQQAKEAGEADAAIAYCRRLLAADPLDDEVQHLLIECLYLSGERVAALRQFEKYRVMLAEELEVEPLDATLELVERIRSERAAATDKLAPPAPPAPLAREEPEAEAVPETEPPRPRPRPLGRRGVMTAAMIVAGAAVAALGIWLWPDDAGVRAAGGPLDGVVAAEARQIAVVPFRLEGMGGGGGGTEPEPSGSAVAELLAMNFEGLGAIRTVDHGTVLEAWASGDGSERSVPARADLVALGRDLNATAVLSGAVHGNGDEIRIMAELVSARDGEVLARADVRGPRDQLFDLVDELTLMLVAGVWTATDIPAPLSPATDATSLAALKHYLRAELHYRRAEWREAHAAYRSAVEEDSMFLPAVRSLAETILWAAQEPRAESAELFERARRLAVTRGSPPRDLGFDAARHHFTMGDGPAAIRAFEELADLYPDDFSIQYQVADAYFHFWPRVGLSSDAVAARLERLLDRDEAFAPAMDHLWWTAMWNGDAAAARRWAAAYVDAAPEGMRSEMAPLATAIAHGDADERARALEGGGLDGLSSDQAALAFLAVALPAGTGPEPARAIALRLSGDDQSMAHRAAGAELMAVIEFASGRPSAGYDWLDAAGGLGMSRDDALAREAVIALYGLGDRVPAGYATPAGPDLASNELRTWVRDIWLSGAIALLRGDRRGAGAAARALAGLSDATQTGVLAQSLAAGLRGELALAAGDTAAAVRELSRASERYPELAPLSRWETLPYYRYRLGEVEAARGNHAAAVAAFHSLEDRSLGDLLYKPTMCLAMAQSLEAMGETDEAAAYYGAAAGWWVQAEPAFADRLAEARAGLGRIGVP